eukprot:PhM_4_TR13847/c0_g1_i1/m.79001
MTLSFFLSQSSPFSTTTTTTTTTTVLVGGITAAAAAVAAYYYVVFVSKNKKTTSTTPLQDIFEKNNNNNTLPPSSDYEIAARVERELFSSSSSNSDTTSPSSSSYHYLRRLLTDPNLDPSAEDVLTALKTSNNRESAAFISRNEDKLRRVISLFDSVNSMIHCIEKMRATAFDKKVKYHVELLQKLALLLRLPSSEPTGSHWCGNVGFQGRDPSTDFRGGGVLSLLNMIYAAETHTETTLKMIDESSSQEEEKEEQEFYLWAVVCINLTGDIVKLLKTRKLVPYVFTIMMRMDETKPKAASSSSSPRTDEMLNLFNVIFFEYLTLFHNEWRKQPVHVMEFGPFKEKVLQKFMKERNIQ